MKKKKQNNKKTAPYVKKKKKKRSFLDTKTPRRDLFHAMSVGI